MFEYNQKENIISIQKKSNYFKKENNILGL